MALGLQQRADKLPYPTAHAPAVRQYKCAHGCCSAGNFGVVHEVRRQIRTPQVECVLGCVVPRLPVERRRYIVDVEGILTMTAPGIADIEEVVRAQDVPARAPAAGMA